jgi:hypothetical protein
MKLTVVAGQTSITTDFLSRTETVSGPILPGKKTPPLKPGSVLTVKALVNTPLPEAFRGGLLYGPLGGQGDPELCAFKKGETSCSTTIQVQPQGGTLTAYLTYFGPTLVGRLISLVVNVVP